MEHKVKGLKVSGVVFCFVIILLFSLSARGQQYFLNPVSGSDSNPGTSLSPFKTMDKAMSIMNAGDIFILADGTYGSPTSPVLFDHIANSYGTGWDKPITFKAANRHGARFYTLYITASASESEQRRERHLIFDGIHVKPLESRKENDCVRIDNGASYIRLNNLLVESYHVPGNTTGANFALNGIYIVRTNGLRPHNILIKDSEIRETGNGIHIEASDYIDVINNHVHDLVGSHIRTGGGNYLLFESNHVHTQHPDWQITNGDPSHGSGFSMHSNNTTLRGNIIHNCGNTRPIRWYQEVQPVNGYFNILIENNLVYDGMNYPIEIVDAGENTVIRNNTFLSGRLDGTQLYYSHGICFRITAPQNVPQNKVKIYNNIIDGCLSYNNNDAWKVSTPGHLFNEHHNIIWAVIKQTPGFWNDPDYIPGEGTILLSTGNTMNSYPANIIETGVFTNYYSKDFTLKQDSIAINLGDPANYPAIDILGFSREGTPDIGAYEYGGTMQPTNLMPEFENIGEKDVNENEDLIFSVAASDPEGEPISYSVEGLPAGATFEGDTFSWIGVTNSASNFQAQTFEVTFTASDGVNEVSQTIIISVHPVDVDNDGLSDAWEIHYFANLDQLSEGDFDNDGITNLNEYLDATDPTVFNKIPSNLVLYLKCNDDPADGVLDSSEYQNDGVCSEASVPLLTTGNLDKAYKFDGVDDCVEIADSESMKTVSFSFSTWINLDSSQTSSWPRIFDKSNGSDGFSIFLDSASRALNYVVYGGEVVVSNSGIIKPDTWQHIAVVYNEQASEINFYVDGELAGTQRYSSTPAASDAPATIGIRGYDNARAYKGSIDDMRLYCEPLTAEQISDIFNESVSLSFAPIGNKIVNEGSLLEFDVITTTPDIIVNLTDHNLPSQPVFNNGDAAITNKFNWTPDYDDAGNYMATFVAANGEIEDFETITITVNNTNRVPQIVDIPNQTIEEASTVTFAIVAADADGDNLTLTTDNIPAGSVFVDRSFSWTPTYEQAGTYIMNFIATDGELEDTEGVIITVNNKNRPPTILPIENSTVLENQNLTFGVTAVDPDGDTVTYTAENLPQGAVFGNGVFSWTPSNQQAGIYQVTFTASDGTLSSSLGVSITVENISTPQLLGYWKFDEGSGSISKDFSGLGNDAALINSASWISGRVGTAVKLDGIDDYLDCGSYSGLNLSGSFTLAAWINPQTLDNSSWPRIFDKGNGSAGYSVFLDSSSHTINYVVYGGNIASSNAGVIATNQWQHIAIVYDDAESIINFYINGTPAGSSVYSEKPVGCDSPFLLGIRGYDKNRAFEGMIDETIALNFALTAEQIAMLATLPNQQPVLETISDKSLDENHALTFEINASDPDGDTITYSASNLPEGAVFNGQTFSWLPTYEQAGVYEVTFTASDGELSDSQTVKITVNDATTVSEGLVGYWKFDEASWSQSADFSGYNNTATLSNADCWTESINGYAVNLDGASDLVNCSADSSLNLTGSLTISAWIKPESFGKTGWPRIVDKGSRSRGFSIFLDQKNYSLNYVIYGGNIASSPANAISLNKWQHIAVVYDQQAGKVSFYVNGNLVGSSAYAVPPLDSSGSPMYLGIRGYDKKRGFDGSIDEVRIYNRPLTGQEIELLQ